MPISECRTGQQNRSAFLQTSSSGSDKLSCDSLTQVEEQQDQTGSAFLRPRSHLPWGLVLCANCLISTADVAFTYVVPEYCPQLELILIIYVLILSPRVPPVLNA